MSSGSDKTRDAGRAPGARYPSKRFPSARVYTTKMILGSRCVLAGGEIGVAAEVLHQSALIQIVQNTHSVTTHSPVLSHDGLVSFSCYRMTMLRPIESY